MRMQFAALLIGSYVLGSIPFGVLVARAQNVDIFQVGSGNIGATNVKRALGWGWALVVFGFDVAKGALPVWAAKSLLVDHVQEWGIAVGIAAVLGHCLSPWLRFKGGKGVATTLGMLLALHPWTALTGLAVFLVAAIATRYVSLSSLLAGISLIPAAYFWGQPTIVVGFLVLLNVFIAYRHKSNIVRLLAGTEPKFNSNSPKGGEPEQPNEGDAHTDAGKNWMGESIAGKPR